MRKLICGLVVLTFVWGSAFAAPERVKQYDAGINLSGLFPHDDDFDSAFSFGGNVTYGYNESFAIGLDISWAEADVDLASTSGGYWNHEDKPL